MESKTTFFYSDGRFSPASAPETHRGRMALLKWHAIQGWVTVYRIFAAPAIPRTPYRGTPGLYAWQLEPCPFPSTQQTETSGACFPHLVPDDPPPTENLP